MCSSDPAAYLLLTDLVKLLLGPLQAATRASVAELGVAVLLAQSLHPADLARALPGLRAAGARQGMRRVRRVLGRPVLTGAALTPRLLSVALRLVPGDEVMLILDSTRCRRWELFTLGVLFGGRVLPVAWAILPYPWPKGRFTPTVVTLLDRVLAAWPPARPVHLLADRGFPSLKFFRCLEGWRTRRPLGYTIRLRAGDWVRLADGRAVKLADLERGIVAGAWAARPAAYQQRGRVSPPATLVVGREDPTYPAHQRGPADRARRLARATRRRAHVLSKGQGRAPETDRVWALLTTAATAAAGVAAYRRRFCTEGTYRDLKCWDLEAVAAHEADAAHLDGLVGLAALAYFIQAALGAAAGRAPERAARARQRQWSTTDRLSVFWRGRQVLHDRAYDWQPWLGRTVGALAQAFDAGPSPASGSPPSRATLPRQEAA